MTLTEAANKLFSSGFLPDDYNAMAETDLTQAVFREISIVAGYYQRQHEIVADIMFKRPLDKDEETQAADLWEKAPIADCLAEAERIARTIKEGR